MSNSLLEDAISYFMDNVKKAGNAMQESQANTNRYMEDLLNPSVMDRHPDVIADRAAMREKFIGDMTTFDVGAIGGMIKPSTWAKYTPEAKAMVTEVANRSPQKFQQVLTHPDDLMVSVNNKLPSGIVGRYRSGGGQIPSNIALKSTREVRRARVPEHEFQHFLTDHPGNRFWDTPTDDAWTVARLLQSRLPENTRGSLDAIIHDATDRPFWWKFGDKWDKRPLRETTPHKDRMNALLAMDEGLAHTAQASVRPGASPEIKKLARDLGVSWEDETREVLWGGKHSPSWNPRDVKPTFEEQKLMSKLGPSVDIPRQKTSEGALELWNALRSKLGIRDARFRHGTNPDEAVSILKEGLRPGSSISKSGGRDYEGYPVTLEFDDSLKGAKDYSSPLGPTMHKEAATTGGTAKNVKKVFFDPGDFSYKEDALDAFRKLRETLNQTGRKDLKIEGARYRDDLDKIEYGGKLSLKELPSFTQHVKKATDRRLQRLFDETLDNIEAVPDKRAETLRARLDAILEEMAKREGNK